MNKLVRQFLPYFVELFLTFDETVDVINKVIFCCFEVVMLCSEGIIYVGQMAFCLGCHRQLKLYLKFWFLRFSATYYKELGFANIHHFMMKIQHKCLKMQKKSKIVPL